jgi:translation initiation factor 1
VRLLEDAGGNVNHDAAFRGDEDLAADGERTVPVDLGGQCQASRPSRNRTRVQVVVRPDMPDKPFHNPFDVLAPLRGEVSPAQEPTLPAAAPPPSDMPRVPRAVVRMERSGRGGKEVTVVDHLALSPRDREAWLKALKTALGCGGTIEGDTLVLQGDQRKRLPALLTARGVRKITVA